MLPQQEVWLQFAIVAIVVLATGATATALYKLFRDLMAFVKEQNTARESWLEKQDEKRTAERNAQREWQAEQDELARERWHEFLKTMQDEYLEQDGRHTDSIVNLDRRISELIKKFDEHDRFVRESISAMRARTASQ